jgi:hypothetical protein
MSYLNDAGLEPATRRDPFEAAAAMHLGLLLIMSSRLDLAVQLYLRGVRTAGSGAAGADEAARLQELVEYAQRLADPALGAEFVAWTARAQALLPLRRALRSGRWLPDPRRGTILLMAGLGERGQVPSSMPLASLEEALATMRDLLGNLHRLCARERGITLANAAAFLTTQPIGVVEEPE